MKLVPVIAFAIGLLLRLLKSDVVGPSIPARARPWVAFGLGLSYSACSKIMLGTPWQQALIEGLTAGTAAITGHDLVIGSLLNGKEVPVPGLMRRKTKNVSTGAP